MASLCDQLNVAAGMADTSPIDPLSAKNGSEVPPAIAQPPLRLVTAMECDVEDQNVPNTIPSFQSFGFLRSTPSRTPSRVVAMCTVEMGRNQRSINAEERQAIFNILKSLDSFGTFTPKMNKSLNIRGILLNILGETAFPAGPYEYPKPLQHNASIILDRYYTEIAAEETLEQSRSSSEPAPVKTGSSKRKRKSRTQTPASSDLPRPPSEDLTFRHIMRGIAAGGTTRLAYSLDKNYIPAPRPCNIFGHNGLQVGDWWPLRVCALRDGAHGAMQAGIAGSSNTGAYSIVVSSTSPTNPLTLSPFSPYHSQSLFSLTYPHTP